MVLCPDCKGDSVRSSKKDKRFWYCFVCQSPFLKGNSKYCQKCHRKVIPSIKRMSNSSVAYYCVECGAFLFKVYRPAMTIKCKGCQFLAFNKHFFCTINGNGMDKNRIYYNRKCDFRYLKDLDDDTDVTPPDFYGSEKWEEIRLLVLERDNECVFCMERANVAHHLYPVDAYPSLRFDLDNIVGTCDTCHKTQHNHRSWE